MGDVVGNCIYFKDAASRNGRRRSLFKCPLCGSQFEAGLENVKRKATSSCGCLKKQMLIDKNYKHGLSNHKVYGIWAWMLDRCYRQNNKKHDSYGGRGIKVCDEWRHDFKSFYDYVTSLDNYNEDELGINGLTIDRIDNDSNYEPGNLRWATRKQQVLNRRLSTNNTSGYSGIHYAKKNNKWIATIGKDYRRSYLGWFNKIEDAVNARNQYIINNNLTEYKIQ